MQLNEGNVSKTSRELGIPRSTIILWRGEMEIVEQTVSAVLTASDTLAEPVERWLAVQGLATDALERTLRKYADRDAELEPSDLRHVATVAGIAADKHLDYRDGRKGTNINVSAQAGVVIQRNTRSTA